MAVRIFALVIRHANHIFTLSYYIVSLACLFVPKSSTLPHKRQDFSEEKLFERKMCVLILYTTIVWNISHSKKTPARHYHKVHLSAWTVLLFLTDFNGIWIFVKIFFKKLSDMYFHENPLSGNRVVPRGRTNRRLDRQTDMTKLTDPFRNFANGSKSLVSWFSLWPLIADPHNIMSLHVVNMGAKCHWDGFFASTSFFPCPYHFSSSACDGAICWGTAL
jgi:hypothetical protein